MRLTKLKIAGFKSFVEPTTITFPSSLTGVVGPNGCGKSNIIDAVRWVMGEISAKHLRGDSMADVIFNGSASRKPLGAASVELVFDNADGKIGGAYASYNEVALRRSVSRDGTSDYFINGLKVRRKDITQLFLGTGLGSRSYAIIEQGMISRVIEARPDDLRAFLEEAAGISRYKERRRETESRIGQTRENLDRLNDLREEVEKQIRHLQRQAATARRYQSLMDEQRRLQAELLVLRLQALDAEGVLLEDRVRERDTGLQAVLAEFRAAEAAIERLRTDRSAQSDAVGAIQGRFYQAGAEVTRLEQSIAHARELRQRQSLDLAQAESELQALGASAVRDQEALAGLAAELARMLPALEAALAEEKAAADRLLQSEQHLSVWQASWNEHAEAVGRAQRETQVERARIEQLEGEQRRLMVQRERQREEHTTLARLVPAVPLEVLAEQAAVAGEAGRRAAHDLEQLIAALARCRELERAQSQALNDLRARWQAAIGTQVSTDALQQAALGRASGTVNLWLKTHGLDHKPRVAEQLRVAHGWERAVETVLGAYLEAVCVEGLDDAAALLAGFDGGHLAMVTMADAPSTLAAAESLQAKVQGPPMLESVLSTVYTAQTLGEAVQRRQGLAAGESVVTRDGLWLGPDWLRLARDGDPHTGVIEREEALREIRAQVASLGEAVRRAEQELDATRVAVREHDDRRDQLQAEVNRLHLEQVDKRAAFDAADARTREAGRRLRVLETQLDDLEGELQRTDAEVRAARGRMEIAIDKLAALEPTRDVLESERERLRVAQNDARTHALIVQQGARDLAVQVEARRTAHASLTTALARVAFTQTSLEGRRNELAAKLDAAVQPFAALELELEDALKLRFQVDGELNAARQAAQELGSVLREHEARCSQIGTRVDAARTALEEARLAVEQVRVRRESLAEQLSATSFEPAELLATLAPDASIAPWELRLEDVRGKIERLGQVNLAAIGEFKEHSERKEYLDRQCKDLTDALDTLETAMRKIDRETRARFQDTFDRVNAGLKEKFPRLFGGGHAYLELAGEESDAAGVSVMARPPGKRNSTISQLSGGEKALTAVALVFAIFDLNPAPFCLLDEVDAPLDENNVGRFCDIVRDMSANVQFIFITHNKSTMELASQLVGVTMSEPGVSRLVAVDVDEAVRMAAM